MNQETQEATPEVSVIICAYNAAPYIAETLESVFAQTYQRYEVIVVNDGSTDETEEILAPYLDRILYVQQENAGPGAARNTGLRWATGRYIALLDSDDQWMPQYLETMVAKMEAEPAIDVLYPNAVLFGSPQWEGKLFQDVCPSSAPVTVEKFLTRECNVFISALFKRSILDTVGTFDESLRGSEDFDLWLRMLQHGYRFDFLREPLARYRKREDSLSSSSTRYFQNVLQALGKTLDASQTTPLQRQLILASISHVEAEMDLILSKQKICGRDFSGALKHLSGVLAYRPTWKLKMVATGLILYPDLIAWVVTKREANGSISDGSTLQPSQLLQPDLERKPVTLI